MIKRKFLNIVIALLLIVVSSVLSIHIICEYYSIDITNPDKMVDYENKIKLYDAEVKSLNQQVKDYKNKTNDLNKENTEDDGDKPKLSVKEAIEYTKKSKPIIGNISSRVYHLKSCHALPEEENRVYFENILEAESSNYRPCQSCNP